jgi:hypothetical protein
LRESRTGKRFPLHLPITIQSPSKEKQKGTTANVSAAGVYLEADTKLTIGSAVRFDIRLPKDVLGTKTDVTIRCTGRVVRKEATTETGKSGLACVIDDYQFKRGK